MRARRRAPARRRRARRRRSTHARFGDLPRSPRAGRPARRQHLGDHPRGHRRRARGRTALEVRFASRARRVDRQAACPTVTARRHRWARPTRKSRRADRWIVELRGADGCDACAAAPRGGESLALTGGAGLRLLAPYAVERAPVARPGRRRPARCDDHLARHGQPDPLPPRPRGDWPLADLPDRRSRTEPGSAEMPSAGRPFTAELWSRACRAAGVLIAPLTLHTGVSSLEAHEAPYPERYAVPAATAARSTRSAPPAAASSRSARPSCARSRRRRRTRRSRPPGGTAGPSLRRHAGPRRPRGRRPDHRLARARGLAPAHARSGRRRSAARPAATPSARAEGYLWHEFGDSHLILR